MIGKVFKSVGGQMVKPYARMGKSIIDLGRTGKESVDIVSGVVKKIKSGENEASADVEIGKKIKNDRARFIYYAKSRGITPAEVSRRYKYTVYLQTFWLGAAAVLTALGFYLFKTANWSGIYMIVIPYLIGLGVSCFLTCAVALAYSSEQLRQQRLLRFSDFIKRPGVIKILLLPFLNRSDKV